MQLSRALWAFLASTTIATNIFPRFANNSEYELQTGPLDTPWTAEVGTNPWPQHPRPRLERARWKNLNGVWRWRNVTAGQADSPPTGQTLERAVLVPSCLEGALSGIMESGHLYSWYQTTFEVPSDWPSENRVLINFGAVDYEATVFVNGKEVGFHRGGYFEFTFDVTDYLSSNGTNELLVHAFDPTDTDRYQIPIGKQTLTRDGMIWYTPCTGIWQTVWLESTPSEYIAKLDLAAGADGRVNVTVHSSTNGTTPYQITVHELGSNAARASATGVCGSPFIFEVDSPRLWTPNTPTLYNITIQLAGDSISSYTGFRTVSRGVIDGVQRPLLNGDFDRSHAL
ncbi:hypothetical protein OPT61_g1362 [Boeremia exigua]|uniref:Uncharacterized protein n=1 Tax=Boeremia exigua TaxID=749465 RepID=A0ACC2IQJ2_9PLEO|nr:hypothetical protein OPT61_g1362 [Boeremia exigua]